VIGPAGIELEAVSRRYATPSGLVRALDGITLAVEPGTSVAITGPSGCGKSTLLGLIGGLDVPSDGRISIGGEELSSLPESERTRFRRERFGLVFQTDNLLPFLTAVENVSIQLALQGEADRYDRCVELLEALGLAGDAHKLPDQLSGGQRQRVAIARALVHQPQLILADEPTGSLDARSSEAVIDLLLGAQRDSGATLVVVTHDPAIAQRLDRTLRLRDGRLASDV
jgi:putative ABC transport system ATP-binding protein